LVDNALTKDVVAVPEMSHNVTSPIPDLSVVSITQGDISPSPIKENPVFSAIFPPQKSTKWDSLPKRKPSTHYGLFAINDAISLSTNHHLAFVTVANKLCTCHKALQSPY